MKSNLNDLKRLFSPLLFGGTSY
uniref:Uncharacterized protein n=1 Tax=Anguilla anguilla TaxID=7936 RepID=A0A0E9XGR8_ANGAN